MTGAELAAIRKAAGLTQAELARRCGIGRHAVSYWECKPTLPRRGWALERITKALGLPDMAGDNARARGWGDRVLAAERAALAVAFARWRAREAERAARRRVSCGAKTRKGTACRNTSEPGKRRCKFHGGKSTGARTPEGIERIREAQRRRWARWAFMNNARATNVQGI